MKILALAIIIIVTGCTSPYSKFYVDTSGGMDFKSSVIKTDNIEVRQGETKMWMIGLCVKMVMI